MKLILPILFAVMLIVASCDTPPSKPSPTTSSSSTFFSEDSPFVNDTTKINAIDEECLEIDKYLMHKPKHNYTEVPAGANPNTKIGYFDMPEKGLTRVLVSENEHQILNLKYFVYRNDRPIRMHYRFWDKTTTPQFTEELMIYFDEEGKIFYARERSARLAEDELPAVMKSIPFSTPTMSKKELYGFFDKYWQLAKPAIDKDKKMKGEG